MALLCPFCYYVCPACSNFVGLLVTLSFLPFSGLSSYPYLIKVGGALTFLGFEVVHVPFSYELAPHGRFYYGVGMDEVLHSAL